MPFPTKEKWINCCCLVQWWEESVCTEQPLLDEDWEGALGVGVGENGVVDQDDNHQYINMYVR